MSADASWILDGGAGGAAPAEEAALPATATAPFFARGLLSPFERDQKADFANGSGYDLLRSHVEQIIGMAAAAPDGSSYGELEWDQSFGTQLHRVRHRRLNSLALGELFLFYVAAAIRRIEPNVRLTSLRIVVDKNQRASRVTGKLQPVDARGAGVGPEVAIDVPVPGEEAFS
jgi:hypothetical protein